MWRNLVHDGTQGNAMTEIALAMAMGFFSIMVLTVLMMGVAPDTSKSIAAAKVVQPATGETRPGAIAPRADDVIAIFARGRFHNANLQPLDPMKIPADRRVILVVDPRLPMSDPPASRANLIWTNSPASCVIPRGVSHVSKTS